MRRPLRHTTHLAALLALLGASLMASGCSLLVDFTECTINADCTATGTCVDGICQEAERVGITDHIVEDTVWTADKVWVLENLIMVVAPATLEIEPGTKILGRRNTGLVSLAGARLEAVGTREKPIVFTSDKPEGQRLSGDWAGIGIVGRAQTNRNPFNLRIITDVHDTTVGGSDDTWDCGTLRYVRVEFGGSEVDGQKALHGITIAGCGSETEISHIQTHQSDADGVVVFGGTVDLRYVVSTRARDDGIDFDTGWRGTAQFLAIQQDILGFEAIELENLAEDPAGEPSTNPKIYNFTLLGADREGDRQLGLFVKNGGRGLLSHGLIMGHKTGGMNISGEEAAAHATAGEIVVRDTLFYEVGTSGNTYFTPGLDEDSVLEDYSMFEAPELNNVFGDDPGIERPYDVADPSWMPLPTNVTGVDPPPDGFDPTAVYRGAFSPSSVPWTEGWTAYPQN